MSEEAGAVADPAAEGSTATKTDVGARQRGNTPAMARPFLYLVFQGEVPLAGGARFSLDDVDEAIWGRAARHCAEIQSSRSRVDRKSRLTIAAPSPRAFLSRNHARIYRLADRWLVEDLGSHNGTYVNGERISQPTAIGQGDLIVSGRLFFMIAFDVTDEESDLHVQDVGGELTGFLTLLPTLGQRLERLRQIAPSDIAITLVGETGTGKEVLARSIHAASGRRGAYVAMNCGTIPDGVLESELFGHTKGSFSGATSDWPGRIRLADHGTLMLDEVIEADPRAQVAFLRVLQEREVRPSEVSAPKGSTSASSLPRSSRSPSPSRSAAFGATSRPASTASSSICLRYVTAGRTSASSSRLLCAAWVSQTRTAGFRFKPRCRCCDTIGPTTSASWR
jgi:hypothetical protein